MKTETKRRPFVLTDIMTALVGPALEHFAIRRDGAGDYQYWVRACPVPRQVFLDSLEIARVDKFDPTDPKFRILFPTHAVNGDDAEEEDGEDDDAPIIH
jgi:hypothetical protein